VRRAHPGEVRGLTHVSPNRDLHWARRLLPLVRPQFPWLAAAFLGAVISLVLRVQVPDVTRRAIDRALIARTDDIAGYAWLLALMGVVLWATGYFFRNHIARTAFELESSLRNLMFQKFIWMPFSYFDHVQVGQMVSRANSDIRMIQMFLGFAPMIAMTLLTFGLAVWKMVLIDVRLTLASLAVVPLVFRLADRSAKTMFPVSWLMSARMADIATTVEENVAGAEVVRSFAAEGEQIALVDRDARRLRWASILQSDARARAMPAMMNLPRIGLAIILLYGGWLVLDGQMTIGDLFAFNAYVLMVQMPFMLLGMMIMMAQRSAASAHRIFEVLDEQPDLTDHPGAVDLVDCRGDVEFDDVMFSYATDGPEVLSHLTVRLRPGETVALVGRTGIGKSTIARLIPRFYDVRAGAVRVDGHDVRALTMESLRNNVGLVLDDSFLFAGTVRENIAFGRPEAPDDEIFAVARAAGADDFIREMPAGYDTVVGERGSTLSGGQRQRIAIARTLLVNPRVLVLDDCTSAIDPHREHEIHGALRTLMTGRTTLLIAHRPATISLATRVLVLEGGRIAADGTHEELLRSSALYAEILSHADELDASRVEAAAEAEAVAVETEAAASAPRPAVGIPSSSPFGAMPS
jgi:ATP-binding cassette, subfamily B, bacterial